MSKLVTVLFFIFVFSVDANATRRIRLVPHRYENQYFLKEVKISVANGKYGLVTNDSKVVIPFIYDEMDDHIFPQHLLVKKNGQISLLNLKGDVVKHYNYDLVRKFRDGYAVVEKNGQSGVINFDGELVLPLNYSKIIQCTANVYFLFQGEEMILADRRGDKLALCEEYGEFTCDGRSLIGATRLRDGKKVNFDYNLDLINCTSGSYEQIGHKLLKIKKDNKYGVMNYNCDTLLSCVYDFIEEFWCDRSVVMKNGKSALIDDRCNFLTDFSHDRISDLEKSGYMITYVNNKSGMIDTTGRTILNPQYSSLSEINEKPVQHSYTKSSGEAGLLTIKNGKIIRDQKRYYVRFKKNGLYGIMTIKGEVAIEPKYKVLKKYKNKNSKYDGYYITIRDDGYMQTVAFPSGQPQWTTIVAEIL